MKIKSSHSRIKKLSIDSGIPYSVLYYRFKLGWSESDAISIPIRDNRKDPEAQRRIDEGLDRLLKERKKGETFNFIQIGKACGVTHQRIKQIHDAALRKVNNLLRKQVGASWDEWINNHHEILR